MTVEDFPSPSGETLSIPQHREGIDGELLFPNIYAHWMARPGEVGSETVIALARRTMFEGYLETGLAKPRAESEDHFLLPSIDKSGHLKTGVIHFAARNLTDPSDTAGARLVDAVDPTQTPTYDLIKSGLPKEALEIMRGFIQSGMHLKEMGALAKSSAAHAKDKDATRNDKTTGVAEVIRNVLRNTVGKNVFLYCSMVKEAHDALTPQLSPANLAVIGTPVVLKENKYRRQTTLLPVIIMPDLFVSNILSAAKKAPDLPTKQRLVGSFLFFSDLLPREYLTEEDLEARALFAPMIPSSRGA